MSSPPARVRLIRVDIAEAEAFGSGYAPAPPPVGGRTEPAEIAPAAGTSEAPRAYAVVSPPDQPLPVLAGPVVWTVDWHRPRPPLAAWDRQDELLGDAVRID